MRIYHGIGWIAKGKQFFGVLALDDVACIRKKSFVVGVYFDCDTTFVDFMSGSELHRSVKGSDESTSLLSLDEEPLSHFGGNDFQGQQSLRCFHLPYFCINTSRVSRAKRLADLR